MDETKEKEEREEREREREREEIIGDDEEEKSNSDEDEQKFVLFEANRVKTLRTSNALVYMARPGTTKAT